MMKTRQSFVTSPLGILLGGVALWYLAGMLTVGASFDKSAPTASQAAPGSVWDHYWFLLKAGGIWAGAGAVATFLLVTRVRLAYQQYLTMPSLRTPNPLLATVLVGVAFAVLLGLVGGLALAHWYLPSAEAPTGWVLKSGRPRYAAAAVAAMTAGLLTLPAAMTTLMAHPKARG